MYITQHVSNQMFLIREVNSDMPSKYMQNKCWKKSIREKSVREAWEQMSGNFQHLFCIYLEGMSELTSLMMNIWFERCCVTYICMLYPVRWACVSTTNRSDSQSERPGSKCLVIDVPFVANIRLAESRLGHLIFSSICSVYIVYI